MSAERGHSRSFLSTVVDKGKITEIEVNDFFAQEGAYADSYANPGRTGNKHYTDDRITNCLVSS